MGVVEDTLDYLRQDTMCYMRLQRHFEDHTRRGSYTKCVAELPHILPEGFDVRSTLQALFDLGSLDLGFLMVYARVSFQLEGKEKPSDSALQWIDSLDERLMRRKEIEIAKQPSSNLEGLF